MRKDLIGLQWLTVDQALLWLKDEAGVQLSDTDLLTHCDAGRCAAYLNVDGLTGVCSDWLVNEQGGWFSHAYGVGKGQILNPRALIEGAKISQVQLYIVSEVRQIGLAEAEAFQDVEWLLTTPPERCHLLFRQSEISDLARAFGGAAAPVDSLKPSHLLTIAALLELLKERGRPIYNQDAIVGVINKRYGEESEHPIRGLGSSNIKDIFAEANKALSGTKPKKPKSQLQ